MKGRLNEPIPRPRSKFLKVKCVECGNEQNIFDKISTTVRCTICNVILAEPTGGKSAFKGTIVTTLE